MSEPVASERPEHRFLIEPHTSTRYAVAFAEALTPGADGYVVCAVHAFADDGCAMVSAIHVVAGNDNLAFDPPWWVGRGALIRLAANGKAAYGLKAALVEEDRKAEQAGRS